VQVRIRWQRTSDPDPAAQQRRGLHGLQRHDLQRAVAHEALLVGRLGVRSAGTLQVQRVTQQLLGTGDTGHGTLVFTPDRRRPERGRDLAHQLVALHRHHLAQACGLAVSHVGDLEVRGASRLARAHEVRVQRVASVTIGHREAGGGKRLRDELAPEHAAALHTVRRGRTREQALPLRLQVEHVE